MDVLGRLESPYSFLKSGLTQEERQFSGDKPTKLHRKKTEKQFQKQREKCSGMPFGPPNSLDYYSSTKPISQLTRTSIDHLRVNVRAKGFYVLLRCLNVHMEDMTIKLLVEDHNGDIAVCYIRNHVFLNRDKTAEGEFSTGTVIVVKEPNLKRCVGGMFVVLVESPTDLTKVSWNHILFQDSVLLGWKKTKEDSETALGWKNTGDELYRVGKYTDSIDAYLMGLKQNPELNLRMMLNLNLSASYLVTKLYESCIKQVSCILRLYPDNKIALFRAGRSHYELREFENAKHHFERLLKVDPSDLKAMVELQRCEERLWEQELKFEMYNLRNSSLSSSEKAPIDFGDGISDVEIANISEKRRGVIATKNFEPGTVIVAEKAMASCWGQELKGHCDPASLALYRVFYQVVSAIYRNPKHFGVLLELPCENEGNCRQYNRFCDEQCQSEPVVDVARIFEVCRTNAIALFSGEGSDVKSGLLFLFTSYIKRSCICNCNITMFSDVIVIRTNTLVMKGEEITLTDSLPNPTGIQNPTYTCCNCKFCEQERAVPKRTQTKRAELVARFLRMYDAFDLLPMQCSFIGVILNGIVRELESTYSGGEKYRLSLFYPYLLSAQLCLELDQQYEFEFMQYVEKALQCLGLSSSDLLRCAENKKCYLPKDAMLSDETMLYQVCVLVINNHSNTRVISRWRNVLTMLDNIFCGEDSKRRNRLFWDDFDISHLFI